MTLRALLAVAAVVLAGCMGYAVVILSSLSDWASMNACDALCPTSDGFGDALIWSILPALLVQVAFALAWVVKGGPAKLIVILGVPAAGAEAFLLDLGGRTKVTPEHLTHSPQVWMKLGLFVALVAVAAIWTNTAELMARRRAATAVESAPNRPVAVGR